MNKLTCPVCDHPTGRIFLRRERVPGTQNLLAMTREAARSVDAARLEMVSCAECGFVWNTAFDAERVRYDQDYENSQTSSPAFEAYVEGLVDHLVVDRGIRDHRIVEVGCGNGSFLRSLVTADGVQNRGVGYDPCYRGPVHDLDGRLEFRRDFLTGQPLSEPCDVIISRHVIEHVPRPVEFLTAIRDSLSESSSTRVFIETPCAEWILRTQTFWDLFHEHCSIFTDSSLSTACQRAGLDVRDVRHVFTGQYLWLEATPAMNVEVTTAAGDIPRLAESFAETEWDWIESCRRLLEDAARRGGVAVWGAGAKGVTLVNLLDPEACFVRCVVDVNPMKQGGFVPGSGHSIVSPSQLRDAEVVSVLVMNPNYRDEIKGDLSRLEIDVELIDPTESTGSFQQTSPDPAPTTTTPLRIV